MLRLWLARGRGDPGDRHWALPDEASEGEKILGKPQSVRLLFFPAEYPGVPGKCRTRTDTEFLGTLAERKREAANGVGEMKPSDNGPAIQTRLWMMEPEHRNSMALKNAHRFPDPLYYYPPQILHIDSVVLLMMIPIGILQRPLGVC
ncbi:hypothetical protein DUI87_15326 [Hirundo rustica rustica]|uniref:Uncharacterized protein n=1 Tax=Hirundo rustica rustica TaxID=333673 RepID=A0A3M0KKW9_HIRRU|nr:hypothetical protein DUI87_15326 [Hirundo rustica rustica]